MEVIKVPGGFEIPDLNMKIVKMARGYKIEGSPIQVKVDSFGCPGSIGNHSVTGVGFKPRYIDFTIRVNSTAIRGFIGFVDYSGTMRTTSWAGSTALFSTKRSTTECILIVNSVGTTLVSATFVSMDSDGFTVNFTTVDAVFGIVWKAVG